MAQVTFLIFNGFLKLAKTFFRKTKTSVVYAFQKCPFKEAESVFMNTQT